MATHSSILAWRIMDRGAWRATVHGVAKSRARLKRLSTHTHFIKVTQKQWVRTWAYECWCSVAKFCPTLCDPMDCSTSGFSVLLPKFAQTPVHWVDTIQPPLNSVRNNINNTLSIWKRAYNARPFFVLKNCIYETLFLSPFTPLLCISIHLTI